MNKVPYSGCIHGVSLTYTSGTLYQNGMTTDNRWGIGTRIEMFAIFITDNSEQVLLYPNFDVDGFDADCTTEDGNGYFPMYCLSNQSVNDETLQFMDSEHLYAVKEGDIYRIYWEGSLHDDGYSEIEGKICMDVTLHYDDYTPFASCQEDATPS